MEIMCVLSNWNYVTSDVTIPIVIYAAFCIISLLFKCRLLIKLFYIINTVGFVLIRASHLARFDTMSFTVEI